MASISGSSLRLFPGAMGGVRFWGCCQKNHQLGNGRIPFRAAKPFMRLPGRDSFSYRFGRSQTNIF